MVEGTPRHTRAKALAKTGAFLLLCALVVAALSVLFEPFSADSTDGNTIRGMYAQPRNKTQVVAFGTSTVHAAFSPMEMYRKRGISAYNCGTSNQSMLASYYLLKDVLRLQGDSVRVVMIDPTTVVIPASRERRKSFAEKAILGMDPSLTKLEAIWAAAREYKGYRFFEHLVPIVSYHSRWNELSTHDFEYLFGVQGDYFSHGQYIRYRANVSKGNAAETSKNNAGVSGSRDFSEDDLRDMWDADEKRYLDSFIDLCRQHGATPVLFKTPRKDWSDKHHDSVQLLADEYGVDFVDLSSGDMMASLGISYAFDYVDKKHANTHGAQKISGYLADYLADECGVEDVRGNAAYSYLEDDAARYDETVQDGMLLPCTDFVDYLGLIDNPNYTVFVAVRGDGASGLTDEMRERLADVGLSGLASLGEGRSYAAVLDGGQLRAEDVGKDDDDSAEITGVYDGEKLTMEPAKLQNGAELADTFTVTSKGSKAGDEASVIVKGGKKAENGPGINIVVYRTDSGELLDSSCFATGSDCARVSDVA